MNSWVCRRCGVRASFAVGFSKGEGPSGWDRADGGWNCLACRREQAVEAAGNTEPTVAANRRRALMEFELKRDPCATDQIIARRVRCATAYVPPVRAELQQAGMLPAQ